MVRMASVKEQHGYRASRFGGDGEDDLDIYDASDDENSDTSNSDATVTPKPPRCLNVFEELRQQQVHQPSRSRLLQLAGITLKSSTSSLSPPRQPLSPSLSPILSTTAVDHNFESRLLAAAPPTPPAPARNDTAPAATRKSDDNNDNPKKDGDIF